MLLAYPEFRRVPQARHLPVEDLNRSSIQRFYSVSLYEGESTAVPH